MICSYSGSNPHGRSGFRLPPSTGPVDETRGSRHRLQRRALVHFSSRTSSQSPCGCEVAGGGAAPAPLSSAIESNSPTASGNCPWPGCGGRSCWAPASCIAPMAGRPRDKCDSASPRAIGLAPSRLYSHGGNTAAACVAGHAQSGPGAVAAPLELAQVLAGSAGGQPRRERPQPGTPRRP